MTDQEAQIAQIMHEAAVAMERAQERIKSLEKELERVQFDYQQSLIASTSALNSSAEDLTAAGKTIALLRKQLHEAQERIRRMEEGEL